MSTTILISYFVVGFVVSTLIGIFYEHIEMYNLYTMFIPFIHGFGQFEFWFWIWFWPIKLLDLLISILVKLFTGHNLIQNYINYITNIIK